MPESRLGQTRRLLFVDAAEDQKENRREDGSKCFKGVTDVVLNLEGRHQGLYSYHLHNVCLTFFSQSSLICPILIVLHPIGRKLAFDK